MKSHEKCAEMGKSLQLDLQMRIVSTSPFCTFSFLYYYYYYYYWSSVK
jgi:hypothetical protein